MEEFFTILDSNWICWGDGISYKLLSPSAYTPSNNSKLGLSQVVIDWLSNNPVSVKSDLNSPIIRSDTTELKRYLAMKGCNFFRDGTPQNRRDIRFIL